MRVLKQKPGRLIPTAALISLAGIFSACGPAEETKTTRSEQPEVATLPELKAGPPVEIRAVWVSVLAEGLKSPEEIRQLVDTVRKANLNTIVAQVHREGATMFPSKIQPRHASVRERKEFDPLATLLKEARDTSGGKQRLAVHAWFNTFKIGEQNDYLDSTPAPIAVDHPDWFTRDYAGTVQYELEQGVPAVQERVISVIEECLKNYDVDGINLDFVRYFGNDRGYNPVALKRFVKQTGFVGRPAVDDPLWSDFRRDQVTAFVKRCAIAVWTYRPGAIMSVDATGWGPAPKESFADTLPYLEALQDWGGWAEAGYVDLVLRMGYKREWVAGQKQEYRDWADYTVELIDRCEGRMLTAGIGGHFNPMEDTLTQYREAVKRGLGTCLFSYDRPTHEASESDGSLRGAANPVWERLGTEMYPEKAFTPLPDWREDRAFIAGYLLDADGQPVDHGTIRLAEVPVSTTSDGNGFFAFFDLDPDTYELVTPGHALDGTRVEAPAGKVTWIEQP